MLLVDGTGDNKSGKSVHDFESVVKSGQGRAYDIPQLSGEDSCVILKTRELFLGQG